MLITKDDSLLPVIALFNNFEGDSIVNRYYHEAMISTLKKLLPSDLFALFQDDQILENEKKKKFEQLLPLIKLSEIHSFPGNLSFFAVSRYRANSFKFFFEMISRWLTPGKRLNVVLVHASDFLLNKGPGEVFTIYEIIIRVETQEEWEQIQHNFPLIQTEISLGIDSAFYAQRILGVKGLSADEKTATIQEFIANRVKRFPMVYSHDVFTEMQHILLTCADEFKAHRTSRHLSRIIGIHYLFRYTILQAVKEDPSQRYIHVKIFKTLIQHHDVMHPVVGILVGMNFIMEGESFGEKQLLKAIQHHIPNVKLVKHSFCMHKRVSEDVVTLYLEIEKQDNCRFAESEILLLRRELILELRNRIQHRQHPIFMPRNEEEIIRTILILSNQLKYARDIPQVSISFDEQTHHHLFFTVIMARIIKPNVPSIPKLFEISNSYLEYIHNRTKEMGLLRQKYPKETTVFQLKIPKDKFLRKDQSIDLYKARQSIVSELSRVVGDIRDYNGGMISKQLEVLSHIRQLLEKEGAYDEPLMENFFYSFTPEVVRPLLSPQAFVTLFKMLTKSTKEMRGIKCEGVFDSDSHATFALVICDELKKAQRVQKSIEKLLSSTLEYSSSIVKRNGYVYLAYLNQSKDFQKRRLFFKDIQNVIQQENEG